MPLPVEQVVEVPLTAPDQQGVPTTTAVGQIQSIENGIVDKFTADNGKPTLRIQKRTAFQSLTTDIRSPVTGAQITPDGFEQPPNLMSSLASQIVVAADTAPHVLAEGAESWSKFPYVYSPKVAKQAIIYGGNTEVANGDCAAIGDVRLYTWSEPNTVSGHFGFVQAFFVDADGTPVRGPFQVTIGANEPTGTTCNSKCVSNGTVFMIVERQNTILTARVYDTDGIQLASLAFDALLAQDSPWDLTVLGSNFYVVRAKAATAFVTRLSYAASVITSVQSDMGFLALADQGVAWAEDATFTGSLFLLTSHFDPDTGTVERAFQISPTALTVVAFWGTGTGSGGGIIYTGDGTGEETQTGILVEMTGVVMADGLHSQLSFFDSVDRRQDRMVFILSTPAPVVTVERVVWSVRSASRTFPLENSRHAVMAYYPSALTTVIAASPVNPTPIARGGTPTYFMLDVQTGQVIGRFNDGVAGMEWTRKGYPGAEFGGRSGPWLFCVPHTFLDPQLVRHIPLGYNTETVMTTEQLPPGVTTFTALTVSGFVLIQRQTTAVSLEEIRFGNLGQAVEYANELFLPGAMATAFTGYSFSEQGVNLPPEQPTFVAQDTAGFGALTPLGYYTHIAVFEWTAPNGKRVRSGTSIPLQTQLTGTNNRISFTGLILHMTTRPNLSIAIYRNIIEAGVPSKIHYKVTNDLIPILNDLDELEWSFVDAVQDSEALLGEPLYVDQGFLERDPCPPFSVGAVFENRVFIVAPDNSIWFTAEQTEDEPLWFNRDALRFPMPTTEEVRRLERLDGRLIIHCTDSHWWVPGGRWPGPDGLNGNMEAPVRLGFNNGCTGFSHAIDQGIAYGSTAGGVWLISRSLENKQLGQALVDEFEAAEPQPIAGIVVDDNQRVAVALERGANPQKVYDQRNGVWSSWTHATDILHTHIIRGRFAYADATTVKVQVDDAYLDDGDDGNPAWYTFGASVFFSLLNIKGLKRVWQFIVSGARRAAHTLTVDATYVTEDLDVVESWEFEPEVGVRFENDFQPKVEEMSQMIIRLEDAPPLTDEATGDSFAWDLTSFTVGTEGGLVRIPSSTRRRLST